jgi:uncharacterized protein YndB with AHSA1/START domain
MTQFTLAHETLVFEKAFPCPSHVLFEQFADPVARATWGIPSPKVVLIYDEADFRVGGRDLSRCGAKADPRFHVEVRYLEIVANQRIVYSETVAEGDKRLSAALHSIEIAAQDAGCILKATVQLASFDGADMAEGVRFGFGAALKNLAQRVAG